MSDLSIPGVSNKYNTQKMIDALMDVERVPLKRMEKEAALDQRKKTAWQDVTRKLSGLRDDARALFGFQNPFTEKIAETSDAKTLTATAGRSAAEESKKIIVEKLASADRFPSEPQPKDFRVPAGEYVFKVGDKEIRFSYKGGSLKDFAETLTQRGGDLIAASVVSDSKTTQVLLIESKKTGAKNRLLFQEKSAELALNTGIIEKSVSAARQIPLTQKGIETWARPLTPDMYDISGGVLTLNPGSELRLPVQPAAELGRNMVLELSMKTEILPETGKGAASRPPGPTIPETGSIEFEGIVIQSGKSEAPRPEWAPPAPAEKVSDLQVLFMEGSGKLVPLSPISDSKDFQKIRIPVGEMASSISSLDLRNRNTHRRVSIKDVGLFDASQRGDYSPRKPLSEAADAVISMDGIEVTRETNQIDDLLPGVTLTLHGQSAAPVEMKVRRDVEGIKKDLIGFIGSYDRVITDIDVLVRRDERVVTDATYLSDEERKKALENLGLLMGDLTLQQLKTSMQRIMMNPYPTSRGKDLTLLAQIGIATDVRKPGAATSVDKTKLRGYLEVDEPKLNEAVANHPDAVKELFGNDTSGDLVVDSGIGFSMDALLRPYVQTAGIFPSKVSNLDSGMARRKREMADYQKHLDDYQARLKMKYGQMEGSLQQMEKSSKEMENFNKRNGQ